MRKPKIKLHIEVEYIPSHNITWECPKCGEYNTSYEHGSCPEVEYSTINEGEVFLESATCWKCEQTITTKPVDAYTTGEEETDIEKQVEG